MIKKEIKIIADAMSEKKADRVVALNLRPIGTAIADYFLICDAQSSTQVRAIADNVEERMSELCRKSPLRKQGMENGFWVILDYADTIVHIFQTEQRNFYRLEDLWADAKPIELHTTENGR